VECWNSTIDADETGLVGQEGLMLPALEKMRDVMPREILEEIDEKGANGNQMIEGEVQIEASMDQRVQMGDSVSTAMDVDQCDQRDGGGGEIKCSSVTYEEKTNMDEGNRFAEMIWDEMGKEGMTKDQIARLLGEMDMMEESGESMWEDYNTENNLNGLGQGIK
jgi:hypothetical protein